MNKQKKIRKISNKQEKVATQDLGMKMMPASGATMFGGGDGRLAGKLRLECKFTDSDTYILHLSDLLKLRTQAIKGGLEYPIFQLEFKKDNKAKYAIVPKAGASETIFNFFEVPNITTYNKSIKIYSGDLYRMMSKSSPIMYITFDRIPILGKLEFAVYEWNDFMTKQEVES